MGNVSPPAHSEKLKLIYGSKTSKTADIDANFHSHPHVLCIWLVATLKGGGQHSRGPPPPP